MSLNRATLIGHLGQDPQLNLTRTGLPTTTLRVAVNRMTRQPDGSYANQSDWFTLVVYDRLAERCVQFLRKGSQIYAEGRLHNRQWQDSQGQSRVTTEIVADNIEFLGKGKPEPQGEALPQPAEVGVETTEVDTDTAQEIS